eukprot:2517897-Prymnesium_polylepis.1
MRGLAENLEKNRDNPDQPELDPLLTSPSPLNLLYHLQSTRSHMTRDRSSARHCALRAGTDRLGSTVLPKETVLPRRRHYRGETSVRGAARRRAPRRPGFAASQAASAGVATPVGATRPHAPSSASVSTLRIASRSSAPMPISSRKASTEPYVASRCSSAAAM